MMYAEGRYDETDIGQRIMYTRSSDGLCKRAPYLRIPPQNASASGTTRHLPLNGEG